MMAAFSWSDSSLKSLVEKMKGGQRMVWRVRDMDGEGYRGEADLSGIDRVLALMDEQCGRATQQ